MASASSRVLVTCAVGCALVGGLIALASADASPVKPAVPARNTQPVRAPAPAELDGAALLKRARAQGERLWSTLDGGQPVELTIDPRLQSHVQGVLARYAVPFGALVAIEPASGRVLAYVSHSTANSGAGDLAASAAPPAASVFKLVTAAALVDAGLDANTRTCYGGGASRLEAIHLVDDSRRDRACVSLGQALGGSVNAVFAKLADRHLQPSKLERYARAFRYGENLPSQLTVDVSALDVPVARLEFARTAAGFWHTHLSPLHGALIAATIANGGVMPRAQLIEPGVGRAGQGPRARGPESAGARRVVSATTARVVTDMMLRTVRDGTAHATFHDARGRPYLAVDVAGKTGSLSESNPYRAYSWWVGFAPADKPVIAIAALVVNSAKWRIKASFLARDALEQVLPSTNHPRCARTADGAAAVATAGRCATSSRTQGAD